MTSALESTASLIQRAKKGDGQAREQLAARYLPLLQRWAHGRLPAKARRLQETNDLVQVTLMRALDRLDFFESTREGAFLAYLQFGMSHRQVAEAIGSASANAARMTISRGLARLAKVMSEGAKPSMS